MVGSRYAKDHVAVVDMTKIKGDLLSSDGIHPNDAGYKQMAAQWYNAFQQADYDGWIKAPVSVPTIHPADPACLSKRASAPLAGEKTGHFCREPPKWTKTGSDGRISHGVGQNGPAKFKPNWEEKTRSGPGYDKKGQGHVKLVDITGNGRADFLWYVQFGACPLRLSSETTLVKIYQTLLISNLPRSERSLLTTNANLNAT